MSSDRWGKLFSDDLQRLQANHLYRERRVFTAVDATHIEWEGKRYVNFASNDYLGLTHDPRLIEAGRSALAQFGAGSGAAALISGYGPAHASAERALAQWKGTEASVLLPSGYQANHAAVQALAYLGNEHSGGIRFLIDKLAHASLIDAVRGSGALPRFSAQSSGKTRTAARRGRAGGTSGRHYRVDLQHGRGRGSARGTCHSQTPFRFSYASR